jgi:hypothetical protein
MIFREHLVSWENLLGTGSVKASGDMIQSTLRRDISPPNNLTEPVEPSVPERYEIYVNDYDPITTIIKNRA